MKFPAADYYVEKIDTLISRESGRYGDYWGWHDDHRAADGGPAYKPALMQVRDEYRAMLEVLAAHGIIGGKALQLGIGPCTASHDALCLIFSAVTSIDFNAIIEGAIWPGDSESARRYDATWPGADTHSESTRRFALRDAPYDFLLIDAGHRHYDVKADHEVYGAMVRKGGIIAFHDALPRSDPKQEVWRYLREIDHIPVLGTEVGIAWMLQQ